MTMHALHFAVTIAQHVEVVHALYFIRIAQMLLSNSDSDHTARSSQVSTMQLLFVRCRHAIIPLSSDMAVDAAAADESERPAE